MDTDRRRLTAVTRRSDAARDRAGERLEPLVQSDRVALGASRGERRTTAVVEDVKPDWVAEQR